MSIVHPLFGTAIYVSISNLLQYAHKNKYLENIANPVRTFSIAHNAGLTFFSLYTFISLLNVIWKTGPIAGHMVYMSDPYVRSLIYWFYISKYYEYFDTFLLYTKGVEPILLQKYHHIGATFCWYLCYTYNVDMGVYATLLNSGVHSVMYLYYLLCLLKVNIRIFRMYITTMQIAQLSIGLFAGTYYYFPPIETYPNYAVILVFDSYIAGLLYLFGKFMVENYFTKKTT
uniref:Very-long-chain 3-oxoacyl-CoA synthase n=1 Tax=viral metagenome TaxID=1070528 RepID=A0A6C0K011_9ZZZZ